MNLKKFIEDARYTVKGINQHKVLALKNCKIVAQASCIQVLAIKLGL